MAFCLWTFENNSLRPSDKHSTVIQLLILSCLTYVNTKFTMSLVNWTVKISTLLINTALSCVRRYLMWESTIDSMIQQCVYGARQHVDTTFSTSFHSPLGTWDLVQSSAAQSGWDETTAQSSHKLCELSAMRSVCVCVVWWLTCVVCVQVCQTAGVWDKHHEVHCRLEQHQDAWSTPVISSIFSLSTVHSLKASLYCSLPVMPWLTAVLLECYDAYWLTVQ